MNPIIHPAVADPREWAALDAPTIDALRRVVREQAEEIDRLRSTVRSVGEKLTVIQALILTN